MSSIIEQIAREVKATFSKDVNDPDFTESLNKLIRLVEKLKAPDVKLDESLQAYYSCLDTERPCFFIDVLFSEAFCMGIFILKSGVTIPLHDHPNMHGIIKVIRGSLRISSYTSLEDEPGDKVVPEDVRNKIARTQEKHLIPVNKLVPIIVGENDQPCLLRPKEGNFQEVHSVSDKAIFLNILAPSYDLEARNCNFYEVLETADPDAAIKTWLVKSYPDEFFSLSLPYYGPEIKL